MALRLTHVRIRNILGIEELEFDAGAFTRIEGANGQGKTSVLEAVKAVVNGGTDATLLRKGASEGEIVLLLDDGTQIRKRITERGQTVSVERDGVQQRSPQTLIKQLADVLSVNPVEFLRVDDKRRVDVLLESLPMEADQTRIRDIVGDPQFPVVGPHALQQIDNAYTVIFDDRRNTNRALKDKESTIGQLRETLPASTPGAASGDEGEVRAALQVIDENEAAEMKRIDDRLAGLKAESEQKVEAWRQEIAKLQESIAKEREEFATWQTRAETQRGISRQKFAQERAPNTAALAAIERDRDAASRARVTRENIARLEGEATRLRSDSERQTSVLDALLAYKAELLSSLPIDGLEVRDGKIYRHGVIFDRLNKAQQVEIAVEIAKLRAGELKVICVDDLEMLDSEHFEAFQDQALASGLQLIVTRVADCDFAIRTHG